MLDFVQGATFSLNVAKVQFNTRNHDLGMTGRLFFFFIHTQRNAANTEGFSNWMGVGSLKIAPILLPPAKNNPAEVSQF